MLLQGQESMVGSCILTSFQVLLILLVLLELLLWSSVEHKLNNIYQSNCPQSVFPGQRASEWLGHLLKMPILGLQAYIYWIKSAGVGSATWSKQALPGDSNTLRFKNHSLKTNDCIVYMGWVAGGGEKEEEKRWCTNLSPWSDKVGHFNNFSFLEWGTFLPELQNKKYKTDDRWCL